MRMSRVLGRVLVPVVLTAGTIAATMPNANAAALPGCTSTLTITLCFDEDAEITGFTVPNPTVTPMHVTDVSAYLDVYRLDVNDTEFELFPCVTLVDDNGESPVCADTLGTLGFELDSRTPLVEDQSVDVPVPGVENGTIRLSVCEASATIRVEPFGINNQPLVTVCASGLPSVP